MRSLHREHPVPASLSVRYRACSRLDKHRILSSSTPSLVHVIRSDIFAVTRRGYRQQPLSQTFYLCVSFSHLRLLPSASITRLLRYYKPFRHPDNPVLADYGFGACYTIDRASRVATSLIFHACQRQYPAETHRCACHSLPNVPAAFSLNSKGSASALPFSRPAQRSLRVPALMVAKSPQSRSVYTKVLQTMSSPPPSALAATNWSDSCCVGFVSTREKRLSTANEIEALSQLITQKQIKRYADWLLKS